MNMAIQFRALKFKLFLLTGMYSVKFMFIAFLNDYIHYISVARVVRTKLQICVSTDIVLVGFVLLDL